MADLVEEELEESVDEETGEIVIVGGGINWDTLAVTHLIEVPVGASDDLVAFKAINKDILNDADAKGKKGFSLLKKMYYVFRGRLWESDPNYDSFEDWVKELYVAGVDYTARSTAYDKMKYIEIELELHGDLDRAVTMAMKHDGLHRRLEEVGFLEIVQDGVGDNASYAGTRITERGKVALGGDDGYRKLSSTIAQLPRGDRDNYVKGKLGIPIIKITSLKAWEEALPFDTRRAPTLLGQIEIEDKDGSTPYQFCIIFERGVGKAIINGAARRLKSNAPLLK